MKQALLRSLESSPLPDELKMRAVEEMEAGHIQMADEHLAAFPRDRSSIIAGSLDPATFGHAYITKEAVKADTRTRVLIVQSTSKPPTYQLFNLLERAALLRSYAERYPRIENPIILLGTAETHDAILDVLTRAHRRARTIFKGRRDQTDSEHSFGLVDKYGLEEAAIQEIPSPERLMSVSSGFVKGRITAGSLVEDLEHLANPTVLATTQTAILRRPANENAIFTERLEAGSSEAMFDKAKAV